MKITLTGSTGFIGNHLQNYLMRLQYPVDRLESTDFKFQDYSRLLHFCGSDTKSEVVIHSAWPRMDLQDIRHLDFARQSCEFLEYCRDNGIRVINIGSHNEYSLSNKPLEETDLCEPITTYGLAKLMVTIYAKNLGFNTLRLSAVYGEGGRTFKDIVTNENARYAMPENTKDFIPIEQVCYAIERLLHARHLYGEVINVASGRQQTAEEIASEVAGSELRWHMYPQKQYEPLFWALSTAKMEKLLNLKPR